MTNEIKEIRELSAEEVAKKLREMREELLNLNIRKGTAGVEKIGRIRNCAATSPL
ncbi:MAG: 50S ribosomal protein L29 [Bacilli bacterium]